MKNPILKIAIEPRRVFTSHVTAAHKVVHKRNFKQTISPLAMCLGNLYETLIHLMVYYFIGSIKMSKRNKPVQRQDSSIFFRCKIREFYIYFFGINNARLTNHSLYFRQRNRSFDIPQIRVIFIHVNMNHISVLHFPLNCSSPLSVFIPR